MDADVVVVGGGLAGLAAATRARELGARVLLLEQGRGERYPCNSRYSGGMFHLDYHDVGLPPAELAASLLRRAPADVNRPVIEAIAYRILEAIEWLREKGQAKFFRVGPAPYEKWVMAPPRPPKAKLDWPGRGPDQVLRRLAGSLVAAGAMRTGSRVVGVGAEDGRYRVRVAAEGAETEIGARSVIFADGGFQANDGLLRGHAFPAPDKVLQRNAGSGIGTSVQIAAGLGAAVSELRSFYGHLVARRALETDELWPYPMIDGLAKAGIMVDRTGGRLVAEGGTGVYFANAVARRADPLDCSAIFDDLTWRTVGRETRVPPNPVLTNHGGELFSAGSLDELARLAGIDPAGLAATVGAFNREIAEGRSKARPIAAAPFHAVPVCAGITYTMGGLVVDTGANVLSASGAPMAGLFAAGAAAGGIEGGEKSFYIGGLCKALALGMISGESAARFAASDGERQQ